MPTGGDVSAAPWTEVHRREAVIRSAELLVFALRRDLPVAKASDVADMLGANVLLAEGFADVETEHGWRRWLSLATKWANANREVRRVRGLAEGRLVRETMWRAAGFEYEDRTLAVDRQDFRGGPIVRVTRIRRAP